MRRRAVAAAAGGAAGLVAVVWVCCVDGVSVNRVVQSVLPRGEAGSPFDPYDELYTEPTAGTPSSEDIRWEDMKQFHDPLEVEEMKSDHERDTERLKEEGYRLASDPDYAADLMDELDELFPEGKDAMGEFERALYHLASQYVHGGDGRRAAGASLEQQRTALDDAEERLVAQQRAEARAREKAKRGVPQAVARARNAAYSVNAQQVTRELEARRRRAFLQREADRILRRRRTIARTTDLGRKEEMLREHREEMARLKQLVGHQPGRKAQLEQVWEKADGFVGIQFNPRTFFRLHDVNGDSQLDAKEIEAVMGYEAAHLHQLDGGGVSDPLAVKEEAARMRDEMLKDYDADKDGMVSYAEFLNFAEGEGFVHDAEWHALNPDEEVANALGEESLELVHLEQLRRIRQKPGGGKAAAATER